MSDDGGSTILTVRKQPRYTNVDYREMLALCAQDLANLRVLATNVNEEEEFNGHIIALLAIMTYLNRNLDCESDCSSMSLDLQSISLNGDIMYDSDSVSGNTSTTSISSRLSSISTDSSFLCDMTTDSVASTTLFDLSEFDYDSLHMSTQTHMCTIGQCQNYSEVIALFSLVLGCSMSDLDTILDTVISMGTISRNEWDSVKLTTNNSPKNRTIIELGPMCYHLTRFSCEELHNMCDLLFGEYETSTYVFKKVKFSFEETMLIALDYMSNGTKYITMSMTYGGDWTRYSLMTIWFSKFIYTKFYHKLSGRSLSYWMSDNKIEKYRSHIFNYVKHDQGNVTIEGLEHLNVLNFRTFGFVDCMQLAMCQPGSGPSNQADDRNIDRWRIQRAFFTKYGKMWGMKAQGVFLPNGMLGNIFLTSVAQNDKGVINISGLEEELERLLSNSVLRNGSYPALYADDIYNYSTVICKSCRDGSVFEKRMTTARVDIEHEFGLTASLFKRLQQKHTWKILQSYGGVNEHLFTIYFMCNVYTCLRGNKTSKKYQLDPPSIEEYLHSEASDRYDGIDASEFMLQFLNSNV